MVRSFLARFAVAALLASSANGVAASVKTDSADPLLTAMQQELAREQANLLLPGMQKPYFIEYRLDDVNSYDAVANFGAIVQEQGSHQRIIRVTVRIGDYQHDSSSSRGDGSATLASSDLATLPPSRTVLRPIRSFA